MGTACAVWSGVGGVGAFIVGAIFFADSMPQMLRLGVLPIACGVAAPRVSS
ncbi:hypothetical protein HYN04_05820 [Phenylobacterium parvum]|uniref:Uncharacterized protein n=1 Tax=Phenylobacterium parvum TaxID=2201350 RepID=A0A2Z3HV43_9CAUL|nr:hypothetical protein HYN04_05820 [Phenylobacterium parvum]